MPLAYPEPVLVGLRQSSGRISIRHVFTLCECGRHSDLEISTNVFTTGRCTFDRASFCFGDWRIFARARSWFCDSAIDLRCADRFTERLDLLLGCDRLVRCAGRVYLVALGMVGGGTRSGCATNEMAVPLASALRLSARYRRIPLHRLNAAAPHRLVVDQVACPNSQGCVDSASALRSSARFWPFRACMAGAARSGSGF